MRCSCRVYTMMARPNTIIVVSRSSSRTEDRVVLLTRDY